jgi:hypothetical protein
MGMAADLSSLGCRVNLYEIPAFADNLEPIRQHGGIDLISRTIYGKQRLVVLHVVTTTL